MDKLAFQCKIYQFAASLTKWQLIVPFLLSSCDCYFVFLTAAVQNPVMHKYFVTKGSKTFIASYDKLG
jgi:hypothetical protein